MCIEQVFMPAKQHFIQCRPGRRVFILFRCNTHCVLCIGVLLYLSIYWFIYLQLEISFHACQAAFHTVQARQNNNRHKSIVIFMFLKNLEFYVRLLHNMYRNICIFLFEHIWNWRQDPMPRSSSLSTSLVG